MVFISCCKIYYASHSVAWYYGIFTTVNLLYLFSWFTCGLSIHEFQVSMKYNSMFAPVIANDITMKLRKTQFFCKLWRYVSTRISYFSWYMNVSLVVFFLCGIDNFLCTFVVKIIIIWLSQKLTIYFCTFAPLILYKWLPEDRAFFMESYLFIFITPFDEVFFTFKLIVNVV